MKQATVFFMSVCLVLSACISPQPITTSIQPTFVLTNATLINGTGSAPLAKATLVVNNDRIQAVGPASQIVIPENVKVIDLSGAYILPGFINSHVHDAYDEGRLAAWAQSGVTTVRDEGILSDPGQLNELIVLRDQASSSAKYARLVSAGYMISVPGGYGTLEVTSPENAIQEVNAELDAGVDLIKVTMESGYAGVTNLPLLSTEELKAIVATAHDRHKLVTAHISQVKYFSQLLEVGVDDLAHIPSDLILKAQIDQLVEKDVYVVPTLTVSEAYGALWGASRNLGKFITAGVKIAMGNDYTLIPQNDFDHFDLGMPMHEITRMSEAGMTPMQIIVASTLNAAHVCGLDQELGSLEPGKLADILVLNADPLQDLSALTQVKMVIHDGEIIRSDD